METILNYVRLRKDLSFEERSFNNIDALILSEMAYVNWVDLKEEDTLLIEACKNYISQYTKEQMSTDFAFSSNIPALIFAISKSHRYQNIKIKKYQEVFDEDKNVQFAAVCFELEDGTLFIAYRGTDSSIVGWKENMQMTYTCDLPCHKLAQEFMADVLNAIPEKKSLFGLIKKKVYPKIYLAGHSKGGHLAMHAGIENKEFYPYITQIYNFDGPGFRSEYYEQNDLSNVLEKIITFRPENSIVGRLLDHKEKSVIVKAEGQGLLQHDPFNWSIDIDDFIYTDKLTKESDEALAYIDRMLMVKSDEERKTYIDLVFSLMDKLDIKTVNDLSNLGIRQGISGLRELTQMNSDERKFLLDVVNFLRLQTIPMIKAMKK